MEIVLEQGYVVENITAMWYKSLNDETDVGLRMLPTDKDAMDMARIGMRDNMVELFVVHKDAAATTRKGCTIEEVEEIDGDEAAAPTADTIGPGPIVLHKAQSLAQAKVGEKPNVVTKAQNDVLEDGDEERSEGSDFSGDEESEDDDYQPGIDDEGDSDEQWSENSSGDTDLQVAFDDSDDDWNADGGLYDVEVTTTKDPQRPKQSVPTEREQGEQSGSVNKGKEQVVAAGLRDEDDGYDSEGLWDVPISDDEGDPLFRRYPVYKGLKNMKEYKWEVGTMYVDRNAFKECVTSYAVHSGRGIWFSKCDSHRCKAVCKEGCKWFAYCHKMKREDSWQLTSYYKKHTCSKATKIGIMSSQWLSKAFMKKICENPKVKLRSLIKKAHSKWNVDLTMTKAARVKQQALDEINGTYGEQYRRIHDYAAELLSQGNRAKFVVDLNLHECSCRKFQLTGYPCEHAMSCIRKMCLDVKNYVNKCYRKETNVDCYQHVIYPLNGPNLWSRTENDDVLPPVFRKPIGRPKLRRNKTGDEPRNNGPLSKLARTGQQQKCSYCFALGHNKRTCPRKRKMEATANKNATAQSKKGAKKGAGTTRTPKNNKIPAKTTTQPATRVHPKRKSSTQVGGSQESQTSSKRARCSSSVSQPQPSTATVTSPSRRTLRVIEPSYPCEHAMSCIRKMCLDVKNYVNKCYRKETYVDCYQHVIYPLNGPNLWSRTENDDVLPPVFRKPIGRPKLRRNKTGDEPRNNGPLSKLARTGQQQKCSYCFALGHNKRTCPRKRKMEAAANKNATAQSKKGAKKGAGTTRTPKPNKIPTKTTTQPATRVHPKRKSSTQVGGSQESQTSSKRARCSSSVSQPQPSTATVTSPSRRTLRFMAKTPPRAWKALG
ncbi:hypothetical protein Ahy_A02g007698 [Arachis hypogaea]|uniref:SWIM-type domain-containing protein n=1 Tax=Arachis hypogaea TaxID=3818 RepID=A0A445ED47_ARAHY|nr:hypothetical protein Ahy_A02g007698 [Arachis hypogaea]